MQQALFRLFVFLLTAFLAIQVRAADAPTAPTAAKGPMKVLLEVDSSNQESWHTAIATTNQIMHVVGMDNARVEIVAWGPGIKFLLKNSPYAADIQSLSNYGVEFAACGNTMKAQHLTKADLASGVTVVPGAIGEIVKRDHEGWTQIHM